MKNPTLFFVALSLCLFSCTKKDNSPKPVADFTFSGANNMAPDKVSFTNNSQNTFSYKWDFGDGSTSIEDNPTHVYETGGTYTVHLTAKGAGGTTTTTQSVLVKNAPTSVSIETLSILAMPMTAPDGSGWDSNSGPDVYFTITDASGNVLISGTVVENVASVPPTITWQFTNPLVLKNLTATYDIKVYDQDINDFPPNPDDFIGGYTVTFSSFLTSGDYLTTIPIKSSQSQLSLQIAIKWQ